MRITEKYYFSETDEVLTIWDIYMSYMRERNAGNALAETFGQFLKWTDGLYPVED